MAGRRKKPEVKSRVDPGAADSLRADAEQRFAGTPVPSSTEGGQDAGNLAHELGVHRIELEMQNDALREAELALTESRDKYLDLFEFAPLGYFTFNGQGLIAEVNLTGATLLGIERYRLVNHRFSACVAPKDAGIWHRHFRSVMETGEKQVSTLNLVRGDGSQFPARLESIRIPGEGLHPVVRMAVSDISLQRQAEDALECRNEELRAANVQLTRVGGELRENEAKLLASLREKEVLLAEIHHRVKNNLAAFISLLALDGTYEDSDAGVRLKKDLQNRARSMALIHETLYRTGNYASVDMNVYLSTLTDQLAETYQTEKPIRIIVGAEGTTLDLNRATPCGLIVNELITNVFKYAFPKSFDCELARHEPPTLRVSLVHSDGSYLLTVSDNGVGLPADFDPETAKSLGLKLVNFLARHQLRAKIEVSREKGTTFAIRFPDQLDREVHGGNLSHFSLPH